jgi:ribosomal protein S18 acetylase RimI-like enzyme
MTDVFLPSKFSDSKNLIVLSMPVIIPNRRLINSSIVCAQASSWDFLPESIENVRIEPLGDHHLRGNFLCKNQKIENFCRNNIKKQNNSYKIRAFVAIEGDCLDVLGYYYLCLTSYAVGAVDSTSDEKFSRDNAVPAVYLGMIGVHTKHDRAGIGRLLMRDAFRRTLIIADNAGTYALTLDAVDEDLAKYYENKFDFQRFADGDLEMFLPLGTIRSALAI